MKQHFCYASQRTVLILAMTTIIWPSILAAQPVAYSGLLRIDDFAGATVADTLIVNGGPPIRDIDMGPDFVRTGVAFSGLTMPYESGFLFAQASARSGVSVANQSVTSVATLNSNVKVQCGYSNFFDPVDRTFVSADTAAEGRFRVLAPNFPIPPGSTLFVRLEFTIVGSAFNSDPFNALLQHNTGAGSVALGDNVGVVGFDGEWLVGATLQGQDIEPFTLDNALNLRYITLHPVVPGDEFDLFTNGFGQMDFFDSASGHDLSSATISASTWICPAGIIR